MELGTKGKATSTQPRCPENINPCLCNSCTDESKDRRDSALFQPTKLPGQSWRSTACYNSAGQGAFGKAGNVKHEVGVWKTIAAAIRALAGLVALIKLQQQQH